MKISTLDLKNQVKSITPDPVTGITTQSTKSADINNNIKSFFKATKRAI